MDAIMNSIKPQKFETVNGILGKRIMHWYVINITLMSDPTGLEIFCYAVNNWIKYAGFDSN